MFGDEQCDGVAAERCALAGREQRVVGLALAFAEPVSKGRGALAGEGHGAPLSSLARDANVGGGGEVDIARAEGREL